MVLDSGEYGPVFIRKALSIIAPEGVHAGITTATDHGVLVWTTGATDEVILRGLTISRTGRVDDGGVVVFNAARLFVDHCIIRNFAVGISGFVVRDLLPVADTEVTGNLEGILVYGSVIRSTIDRCKIRNNRAVGIKGRGPDTRIAVRDTEVSANGTAVTSDSFDPGERAEINLERCLLAYNGVGVRATSAGFTVRVSDCTITNNDTGLAQSGGGTLLSRGNNTIEGNGVDIAGTLGSYGPR